MIYFSQDRRAPAEDGPAIEWEETNCLLCGSNRSAQLLEAADPTPGGNGLWFAVARCQECGLCYTNPRPAPHSIGQFYLSNYKPHRKKSDRQRSEEGARPRKSWLRWLRAGQERKVLPWHGQGRLLDFGCGNGSFLERMRRQGWNVTGLDVSSAAAIRARDELGLNVLVGTLPHPQLSPGSFDMITMWQSLEHVHDPLEVLRQARGLLAPGGKLLVAVPNIDSMPFRWFGPDWFALDLPRHLTHFSPKTLTLMLKEAGFHAGPTQMLRHSQWLRSSARLACLRPHKPYWQRWLKSKPVSSFAALYCSLRQQSDCMIVVAE